MVNVIGDEFLKKDALEKNLNSMIISKKKLKVHEKWDTTLLKPNTIFYFVF